MSSILQVEPVTSIQMIQAIRFVCGGAARSLDSARKAEVLIDLVRSRGPNDVRIFWARRDGAISAAAMVVANPGRAGMIFYSPPAAVGVDRSALSATIRLASLEGIKAGLSFVQALLESPSDDDVLILRDSGFQMLAELIYMSLDLQAHKEQLHMPPQENEYLWKTMLEVSQQQLAELLSRTYEKSLDCPALSGLRQMDDVIASHKSCGRFNPQYWWVPCLQGKPAGCILVNDYPQLDSADVVYLGVVPEFRGRSLARIMLRRAGRFAWQRGLASLTLAVDAANVYALKAYEAEGFVQKGRRVAYAMLGEDHRP